MQVRGTTLWSDWAALGVVLVQEVTLRGLLSEDFAGGDFDLVLDLDWGLEICLVTWVSICSKAGLLKTRVELCEFGM